MIEDDMAVNILHLSINDDFLQDFFSFGLVSLEWNYWFQKYSCVIARRKLDIATLPEKELLISQKL